jgi:hypothetical protein
MTIEALGTAIQLCPPPLPVAGQPRRLAVAGDQPRHRRPAFDHFSSRKLTVKFQVTDQPADKGEKHASGYESSSQPVASPNFMQPGSPTDYSASATGQVARSDPHEPYSGLRPPLGIRQSRQAPRKKKNQPASHMGCEITCHPRPNADGKRALSCRASLALTDHPGFQRRGLLVPRSASFHVSCFRPEFIAEYGFGVQHGFDISFGDRLHPRMVRKSW